jgi:hypothetical protein
LADAVINIKADNILTENEDRDILEAFVDAEMTSPSPRKPINGKPIYVPRQFGLPNEYEEVVLTTLALLYRVANRKYTMHNPTSTAVQKSC